MKKAFVKFVGCLTLLAMVSGVRAEVIYLQNFGNNSTNNEPFALWNSTVTGAGKIPWDGLIVTTGGPNAINADSAANFGFPNAANGAGNTANVGAAAGVTESLTSGWIWLNQPAIFAYTLAPVAPAAGNMIDTLSFSWASRSDANTNGRAAVKIGADWYVSSATVVGTNWEVSTFDFFAVNWYAFTAEAGSPFAVDVTALTGNDLLGLGNIGGFGMYVYDGATKRLDNFTVDATFSPIPEPSTTALLLVGGAVLAFCCRRRKA